MGSSRSRSLAASALALAIAGCSGAKSNVLDGAPGGGDGGTPGEGGAGSNAPPHALATMVLGESHTSGQSTSTAIVSASFVPDASQARACTTSLAGCTIPTAAVCDGTTGPLCTSGQTCALDATCRPTCQTTCNVQCPTGQECYFATASTQSCRATQTFDGGDLVFSGAGLASSITLFPPAYTFSNASLGNPLVPGGQIQVTGAGSTGAGFAAFQETFTATTLLQTVPSLSSLTAASVYSAQGLALGWQPGGDAIQILLSGPNGTAECPAGDASGAFVVPPAVISAVAGTGSPAITIAVSRQRLEEKTDGKTQGTLVGETVQPAGYFDLTTVSTETFTVAGCGATQTTDCQGKCGTLIDACGTQVTCGACTGGLTCGGGGAPNVCGTGTCTPVCAGKACGASDGCAGTCAGGTCGGCGGSGEACCAGNTCATGLSCGGGGQSGVCGCAPSCVGAACGASDGCGGTCTTGSCAAGLHCSGGACVCDGTSCAGCCSVSGCEAGTDASACGVNGNACVACSVFNGGPSCESGGVCGTSTTCTSPQVSCGDGACCSVYGYATSLGGTGTYSGSPLCVRPVSIAVAGTLVDIGIIGSTAGTAFVMGLYTDNAGVPGTLVAQTSESTLTTSTLVLPTPATSVAAGSYWIAVDFNGTATVEESPATTVTAYCATTTFSTTLPETFPSTASYSGRLANWYVLVE